MDSDNNSIESFIIDILNLYSQNEDEFAASINEKYALKGVELARDFRYALNGKMWKVKKEAGHSFLLALLQLLLNHIPDYHRDIEILDSLIDNGKLESKDLLLKILDNDQKSIIEITRENGLSIDFITFFSIFSAYGYRNSLKKAVEAEYKLIDHISGICPVCGHWPGIAYLVGEKGTRIMSCICCGAGWTFKRVVCSFCLTADKDKLGYLNVEGEEEVSAYACENCRRYLKTVRHDMEFIDLEGSKPLVDYLNSSFVDIAALQNSYVQESLLGTKFEGPVSKEFSEYRSLMVGE